MRVMLKEGFHQVCVWPGTIVQESEIADFVRFFQLEMNTRVQFLETVVTGPDLEGGVPVPGTGGRHDVFFAVHDEDVGRFAVPRLSLGIRWVEDALMGSAAIWPEHIRDYSSRYTADEQSD